MVLHVGCGPKGLHRLHGVFHDPAEWSEVRLDLDPAVQPDIVCSTADMRRHVRDGVFDSVWSSHNIEHLYDHEVPKAFAEIRRVLRSDGAFLVRCPDLEAVVEAMMQGGLESVAYMSPAGPITPLDMLYGHRKSIERGNTFMAHHTAFTDLRLGRMLLEAGFVSVRTKRAPVFDLWAIAFAEDADQASWLAQLAAAGLAFEE
ncbi:MAG: SAM-dependent methyltransferase [Methylobacterium sp.]|nr:MAG: SAM-dependent methyltransferase [Methylobacterium sp.]